MIRDRADREQNGHGPLAVDARQATMCMYTMILLCNFPRSQQSISVRLVPLRFDMAQPHGLHILIDEIGLLESWIPPLSECTPSDMT